MSARTNPRDRRPIIEIGPLLDAEPPHDHDAESALLGSLILDGAMAGDIAEIIAGPDDFHAPQHQVIYERMLAHFEASTEINVVLLRQELEDADELERVGGLEYLLRLADIGTSSASLELNKRYAQSIADKAKDRRIIEHCGRTIHECYHPEGEIGERHDRAESGMMAACETRTTSESEGIGATLQRVFDNLQRNDGQTVTGLQTGFYEIDDLTGGLHPSEVTIIAARPSAGKTSLAMNMAEHIAINSKQPVAFFSLEMNREQLASRILSSRSAVDAQRMRRNALTRQDFHHLEMTLGEITRAPIYIDDQDGVTINAMRAKARRLKQRHDIQVVFIDYLQLMSAPSASRDGRVNEVGAISRGVKALARELAVPVVCLSQLNRSAENREGHRPRMSDLRESGAIEQDADNIVLLHREDYYHRGEDGYVNDNQAEAIFAKQRNGPIGTVRLIFDGATTRFWNLANPPQQRSFENA